MGTLYVVAVPLGNLQDITLRAIETLNNVDCIACEDTRTTQILLNKYDIKTKLVDCHKFNEKERSKKISDILGENGKVALVSDAGTPTICDPGSVLEGELMQLGHKIVPIPGASAIITFLSAVPRKNEFFTFVGFLPKTKQKRFEVFQNFNFANCVFYDSPNRLISTLQEVSEYFGEDKKVAIGRELTKVFEEIKIGTAKEILDYYQNHTLKGEIVGMLFADEDEEIDEKQILKDIETLKAQGFSDKDISKILSSLKDISKNKVYELSVNNSKKNML